MKSILIIATALFFIACNDHPQQHAESKSATDSLVNSAGMNADDGHQKGAQLIAANDCLTCHRIDEKSNGPSYRSIANRYDSVQGNVDMLQNKILKGGTGAWGNVAMTPHTNLSPNDAQAMVRYILSLRNNVK